MSTCIALNDVAELVITYQVNAPHLFHSRDILTAHQCALTFWTAAFPGLARDLPEVQESEALVAAEKKT